ncbi:hypothetical protein CYY_003048 [Polysphondylium violaceum]|uniref:BTB domain-containing protein n=1 Tax=Polysphondylium violaceum TaxID=133409 RepID=A0A8J4PXQ7_9MYCE|nr:hypothetical protein CYY_003048 [Polysphondylium violaceum]
MKETKSDLDQFLSWGWISDSRINCNTPSRTSIYSETIKINRRDQLQHQVTDLVTKTVSIGLAHALVVDSRGKLFALGKAKYGRLGNGNENRNLYNFEDISKFMNLSAKVTKVSCGSMHSAFVTDKNELYTFGRNNNGQLGLSHLLDMDTPTKIKVPSDYSLGTVKSTDCVDIVSCGSNHTIFSLLNGCVYGMGSNKHQQLGIELEISQELTSVPKFIPINPKLEALEARYTNIKSISCGQNFTILVKQNDLYSFGQNDLGQCGFKKDTTVIKEPTRVIIHSDPSANKDANDNDDEDDDIDNDIEDDSQDKEQSKKYNKIKDKKKKSKKKPHCFVSVSSGIEHSLALTNQGKVFGWGSSKEGQLGQGPSIIEFDTSTPIQIGESLIGLFITKIACGAYHSLVLSDNGDVYAFGLNDYGQLGNGSSAHSFVPMNTRIPESEQKNPIQNIYAGGRCSMLTKCTPSVIKVRDSTFDKDILSIYSNNTYSDVTLIIKNGTNTTNQDTSSTSIDTHKIFLNRNIFNDHFIQTNPNNPYELSTIHKLQRPAATIPIYIRTFYKDNIHSDYDTVDTYLFSFVNQEKFSDVKILVSCQGEPAVTFHAHKCILVARSLKFKTQLESSFAEGVNDIIKIYDVSPSAYNVYLTYLYTDKLNIDNENCIELLLLSHTEMQYRMKEMCEEYLYHSLDTENVCEIFDFINTSIPEMESSGDGDNGNSNFLEDQCIYIIAKNIESVSQTDGYKNLSQISKEKLNSSSIAAPKKKASKSEGSCIIC